MQFKANIAEIKKPHDLEVKGQHISNLSISLDNISANIYLVVELFKVSPVFSWQYLNFSHISSSKGWVSKEDFKSHFRDLGYSTSSIYKIIHSLEKKGLLVKGRNGAYTCIGRNRIVRKNGGRIVRIPVNILLSKQKFLQHIFLQSALLLQQRYRYAKNKANQKKESYVISDLVQKTSISSTRIGVSFSKIAEFLGVSKTYAHKQIRHLQKKQSIILTKIPIKRFFENYKDFVKSNVMLFYQVSNNRVTIFHKLSSTYPQELSDLGVNNWNYSTPKGAGCPALNIDSNKILIG